MGFKKIGLLYSIGESMVGSQLQKLEKLLLPEARIFVETQGLAFFDVKNPKYEPIDVAEITGNPMEILYGQQYNFLVGCEDYRSLVCGSECEKCESEKYFRTDNYKGRLRTVSVTSPCIVFCAFTRDDNGRIESSGVYHYLPYYYSYSGSKSTPVPIDLRRKLLYLVETVGQTNESQITVKAVGGCEDDNLQEVRDVIIRNLGEKDIKIESEHLLLGGECSRITEFDPRTGQLITYFKDSKKKTIL